MRKRLCVAFWAAALFTSFYAIFDPLAVALKATVVAAQPTVDGPTTQLERMGAVRMRAADPVLVEAHRDVTNPPPPAAAAPRAARKAPKAATVAAQYAEAQATAKAKTNAARARCLRENVDYKIDRDIQLGGIRDFGSVLEWEGCMGSALDNFRGPVSAAAGLVLRDPNSDEARTERAILSVEAEILRDKLRRMAEGVQPARSCN